MLPFMDGKQAFAATDASVALLVKNTVTTFQPKRFRREMVWKGERVHVQRFASKPVGLHLVGSLASRACGSAYPRCFQHRYETKQRRQQKGDYYGPI